VDIEDVGRLVVRALGLMLLGCAVAGAYDLLIRPDPFAGVSALPPEFAKLDAVLSTLKGHMDAWRMADGIMRGFMAGLGVYMLVGGRLFVQILCRALPAERSA